MGIFKIKNKKRIIFLVSLVLVIVAVFLIPHFANAAEGEGVKKVLAWIILPIIGFLGKLLTVLIRLLIAVVQYNDFTNSSAVSKGWIIIRDVFNIAFVIVLLIIAFCTVLKIEKYSYKRLLGGFLMAAVLVNFSKLICGFIIDFAQILTLTFVNAFKAVGEGNLAEMLGLKDLMSMAPPVDANDATGVTAGEKIGALFLGLIMSIIALVVVGVILMIFVFRIVVLWILVVLSPLAFMASVLPSFQSYGQQWWQKFTSQVIIGPILAFFLWLSFSMVYVGSGMGKEVVPDGSEAAGNIEEGVGQISVSDSSVVGKPQNVLNFVIGIAMLIGSLMAAQQLGVAGGQMAGKTVGKIQAVATGIAKAPFKGLDKAAKWGLKTGATNLGKTIQARTGIPVLPSEIKKQYQQARKKIDDKRYQKFISKRTQISEQLEKHGWIGGTARFAADVVGVGKRRIKIGQDKVNKAREVKDKYNKTFTKDEENELKQQQQQSVDKENSYKEMFNSIDTGQAYKGQKETVVPLLSHTLKDLETRRDELIINAEKAKDPKQKSEALKESGAIEQEIKQVKNILPQMEKDLQQGKNITFSNLFKNNKNFEELFIDKGQESLNEVHEETNKINLELEAKTLVSSEEKQKLHQEFKKAEEVEKIGLAQLKSGQGIVEPNGPYSRRVAEAKAIKEKQKELPIEYDQGEYKALAQKARLEEKDWTKYQAILEIMAKNGDWNEILLEDKVSSGVDGEDKWAHLTAESFDKSYEDVQGFVHKLGNIAMSTGQYRLSTPYEYSEIVPNSGVYQYVKKTPESEQAAYLYYSGGGDQEKRSRGEGRLGTFSERPIIDDTGKVIGRAPILDELAKVEVLRSWKMYDKELNALRFNKDKTYYLGAPKTTEWLKQEVMPSLKHEEERKKFDLMVKKLERAWDKLGRTDPEKVPPGEMAKTKYS